jgi:hypothetical protein
MSKSIDILDKDCLQWVKALGMRYCNSHFKGASLLPILQQVAAILMSNLKAI